MTERGKHPLSSEQRASSNDWWCWDTLARLALMPCAGCTISMHRLSNSMPMARSSSPVVRADSKMLGFDQHKHSWLVAAQYLHHAGVARSEADGRGRTPLVVTRRRIARSLLHGSRMDVTSVSRISVLADKKSMCSPTRTGTFRPGSSRRLAPTRKNWRNW